MENKYSFDAVAFAISIAPAILLFGLIIASIFEENIRIYKRKKK